MLSQKTEMRSLLGKVCGMGGQVFLEEVAEFFGMAEFTWCFPLNMFNIGDSRQSRLQLGVQATDLWDRNQKLSCTKKWRKKGFVFQDEIFWRHKSLRTWCLTSAGWWIQSSPSRVIAHHCLSSLQSREKVCNLFLKIVSIFCCASYKRISLIILHLSFSLWDVWPLRHIKRVLVSL